MDRYYYRWTHAITGWNSSDTYKIIDRKTGDVIAATHKLEYAEMIINALNK